MKQKLLKTMLLLSALVAGTSSVWATDPSVTFTFNTTAGLSELGITAPSSGSGTDLGDDEYTKSPITMTATDGGTNTRVWNSSGKYSLRVYKTSPGGTLTFSTSSSYNIKTVALGGSGSWSASTGTMDGTDWSGTAQSVTFTCTANATISTITVTYVATATPHALSSAVSPAETGTVTLGATTVAEGATTTISATPNDGYRFVDWSVSGTGSSVASTTSASTTFTMGTADATVTANFEAIPTHTLSSAVSPVGAGTVTLGATSVREGSTTTASVAANSGYEFTGWSISGTGATLSSTTDNPTTVTMGTANATVTATFEAVTTYEINWSVNGVIVKTENVKENAAISFDDPTSGVPTGYTFKGWVREANKIVGTTDTDPKANYVTSANSTEDITYYAVLAVGTPGTATWTLDYSNESSLSASTSWGTYGDAYEYTASDGGIWTVKAYKNAGMQINTGKNSSIKVPSCAGNIQSISITCSAAKAVGFSSTDYSGSGTITYLATGTDATSQTLDLSSNSAKVGYIVPKSGSTSITKIVVTYANTTYSHFCTAVSDVPAIVTADSYATYASELPLDFTSSSINAYIAIAKGDKSGVTFTQVKKVPANTGVLLYKDGGASEYIPVLDGAANDVTGNKFVKGTGATVASDDGENYNYILNKVSSVVGFYKANGKKVAANRAYISIPKASGIKEFISIDFEDDATSIQNSKFEIQNEEAPIYNLAGQRLNKMQKGINIVNGKKVLF